MVSPAGITSHGTKDSPGSYEDTIWPVENLEKYQVSSKLYLQSYALGVWYAIISIPMRNVTHQTNWVLLNSK